MAAPYTTPTDDPRTGAPGEFDLQHRFVLVRMAAYRAAGSIAVKASNVERLLARATTPSALCTVHDALPQLRAWLDELEAALPPRPEDQ